MNFQDLSGPVEPDTFHFIIWNLLFQAAKQHDFFTSFRYPLTVISLQTFWGRTTRATLPSPSRCRTVIRRQPSCCWTTTPTSMPGTLGAELRSLTLERESCRSSCSSTAPSEMPKTLPEYPRMILFLQIARTYDFIIFLRVQPHLGVPQGDIELHEILNATARKMQSSEKSRCGR